MPLAIAVPRALARSNPIEFALNQMGYWALLFLLCTLACTPLSRIAGWAWPLAVRRMLGLFAFTYAALHVSVYLGLDQFFDLAAVWKDVSKRPFITVGTAAFVMLIPLAITSTPGMIRRLGGARWRNLHTLAYFAAIAGVIHFVWRVKKDVTQPVIFGAILGVLLLLRLYPARRGNRPAAE
jgi:sulfoxide reductase heme-binding subunit YedZ